MRASETDRWRLVRLPSKPTTSFDPSRGAGPLGVSAVLAVSVGWGSLCACDEHDDPRQPGGPPLGVPAPSFAQHWLYRHRGGGAPAAPQTLSVWREIESGFAQPETVP